MTFTRQVWFLSFAKDAGEHFDIALRRHFHERTVEGDQSSETMV